MENLTTSDSKTLLGISNFYVVLKVLSSEMAENGIIL